MAVFIGMQGSLLVDGVELEPFDDALLSHLRVELLRNRVGLELVHGLYREELLIGEGPLEVGEGEGLGLFLRLAEDRPSGTEDRQDGGDDEEKDAGDLWVAKHC